MRKRKNRMDDRLATLGEHLEELRTLLLRILLALSLSFLLLLPFSSQLVQLLIATRENSPLERRHIVEERQYNPTNKPQRIVLDNPLSISPSAKEVEDGKEATFFPPEPLSPIADYSPHSY